MITVSYPKHGSLLLFRLVFDVVTINGRVSRHRFLNRTEVRIPATAVALLIENRFLFSPLSSRFHREVTSLFSCGSLPYEYSLTHCLVARAALTLVFSTRLLSRSFFSSPRITDVSRSFLRFILLIGDIIFLSISISYRDPFCC